MPKGYVNRVFSHANDYVLVCLIFYSVYFDSSCLVLI